MEPSAILPILLLVFAVWVISSMVFVVTGKTAAILETFGKPHLKARMPGLHFKNPWPVTRVAGRVDLRLTEIEADVSVKTADNAFMSLPVKVQYRASNQPQGAVLAFYELDNPQQQISSYVLNQVRQTASGLEMSELYNNRDAIEQQVGETLAERFEHFGYYIENVLVDEPQPSIEVRDAFNKVIASKRAKEAAENEAEAERIRLVGTAKAEAESKKLQGQGMAQMRQAIAEGLENAMETMKKAGLSSSDAIMLLNETNRLDTITNAAAHGNLVLMDIRSQDTADMAKIVTGVRSGDIGSHGGGSAPVPQGSVPPQGGIPWG